MNRELVIKNYLADKNARLEERENISRNIHNSVGHSITAAIMTLDAADLLSEKDPNQAREKLNAANRRIRTGLEAIRHAVRVLDEESESISAWDFLQELNDLTDSFVMDTTVQVYQDYNDLPDWKRAIVRKLVGELFWMDILTLVLGGVFFLGLYLFNKMQTAAAGRYL